MPRPETVRPCLNWAALQAAMVVIDSGWRTLDVDVAAAVGDEVGGVDFEFLGGGLEHHGAGFLRGLDDGVADAVRAAGGEAAHAVRAGVAVGGVDVDVGRRGRRGSRRRSGG